MILRATGRAPERARSDLRREEDRAVHHRRRGDRKRGQDRPSRDRASGVIAFTGAFHGRTIAAMTMTGKVAPYKKGSDRRSPRSTTFLSRSAVGVTVEESLKHIVSCSRPISIRLASRRSSSSPCRARAVSTGAAGTDARPAPDLRRARHRADRRRGRRPGSGAQAKCSRWSITTSSPIVICVAKSLAGGMPLWA